MPVWRACDPYGPPYNTVGTTRKVIRIKQGCPTFKTGTQKLYRNSWNFIYTCDQKASESDSSRVSIIPMFDNKASVTLHTITIR